MSYIKRSAPIDQGLIDKLKSRILEKGGSRETAKDPECPVHETVLLRAVAGQPVRPAARIALAVYLGAYVGGSAEKAA